MRVTALWAARPVMGCVEPGTFVPEPGESGVALSSTPLAPGCSYIHALAEVVPLTGSCVPPATAHQRADTPAATTGRALARKDDRPGDTPHWERRARDRPFAHGRLRQDESIVPAQTGRPRHIDAFRADDEASRHIRESHQPADENQAPAVVLTLPHRRDPQQDAALARELMIRWCRALSRRKFVRLADRNAHGAWINSFPHSADVEQAAEGQPVAMLLTRRGRQRGDAVLVYLLWDLDAKRSGIEQVARDEALLTAHLEACGISVVAATSGPGGGRHLWTSCPEGLPEDLVDRIAAAATRLAPSLDPRKGSYAAARVPGSPHRDGGYVRLDAEHPADVAAAIALLQKGSGRAAFELLAQALELDAHLAAPGDCVPSARPAADDVPAAAPQRAINTDAFGARALGLRRTRRTLPASTAAALARVLEPHEDYSAHAGRVLVGLALSGWQLPEVMIQARTAPGLEYLRTQRLAPGRPVRRALSAAQLEAHTARQWDRAVRYAALLPAPAEVLGDRDEAAQARRLAEMAVMVALELVDDEEPGRWGGKWTPSGPADLAVVLYALQVMLRVGLIEVELPCRAVGRGTCRHHDTAARALWRLDLDGIYLRRSAPAAGPHGARYALSDAIVQEAARRLAALDQVESYETEAFPQQPATVRDETAGHDLDRGAAAPLTGVPTQGNPPPLMYGEGEGEGRCPGPLPDVLTESVRESGPVNRTPEPQPGGGAVPVKPAGGVVDHVEAGAFSSQPGARVTTSQKQDHQRPIKIVFDVGGVRTRIEQDLGILAAELCAHGTGHYDRGRHAAITLLAVTRAARERRGPLTEQQIAETTGLTAPTVGRHLRALQDYDLVAYSEARAGWYSTGLSVTDADQGQAAGTAARRAERHRIDAIVWAWWQAELAWLRMSKLEKRIDARKGHRRQPYGQQAIGPVDAEMFTRLRYPRREAAIRQHDGRTLVDLVPDHAEAARIVHDRIHQTEGRTADPAARAAATAWPPLDNAPDFVRQAARELATAGAA